ncbi:hypothetical protein SDC9_77418 [bioreactor metagenome]|uniref:PI3K/PI4K catalytic domain-containing protein n=1 Tax=bioreactor metagenome TaxID=1076179 RepID=A0A644YRF0_9ZZZZ
MVFKAEFEQGDEPLQIAAQAIGITESAPNLSGRNVATYRLNQALGLNLIPKTQFAAHKGQAGSVMALAPGTSVQGGSSLRIPTSLTAAQFAQREQTMKGWLGERGLALQGFDASTGDVTVKRAISPEDLHARAESSFVLKPDGTIMSDAEILSDEELGPDYLAQWHSKRAMMETIIPDLSSTDTGLCSGLNQLQWLDCLCGQTDRHPGNIFVERAADGSVQGVQGIDNDASFGVNTSADKAVVPATVGNLSPNNLQAVENFYKGMPTMIDAGLKEQLLTLADRTVLHANTLENLLDGCLSPQEVAQARVRLNEIAEQLRKKDASGADVVTVMNSPADWSSPDLEPYPDRSYMAACMENIAQFAPQPMPVTDQADDVQPSDAVLVRPDPFRPRVIDSSALAADFGRMFG